jgi:6-phosphogluconolactonase
MKNLLPFILLSLFIFNACSTPKTNEQLKNQPIIFVGTYTQKLSHVKGNASGIYTCRFDTLTGVLTVVDSATDIVNPSFLTISPDKKYVYSVGEEAGSGTTRLGKVAAYKNTGEGKLLKINELPSYGNAPCHISTDKTGQYVFVANYLTGNVLSYGVKTDGGLTDTISMDQHKAPSPWAHNIQVSADNKNVFAVDKGADKIYLYALGEKGQLIPKTDISTATGAGPRHLDFNPTNPYQFVAINENSSAMGSYVYDANTLKIKFLDSLSTLPKDFTANNTCADVHFHPNGKFVYGSNRGHNSIVIYSFNPQTGKLTFIGHESTQGEIPRNFMITPDGKWLLAANQNSDSVVSFKIDGETGKLTMVKKNIVMTPVCLKMM